VAKTGIFVIVAAASLAGCAADSALVEQLFVVPDNYDTLDCPGLIANLRTSTERVRQLILFMEKAGQDAAGSIVNVVGYDTEYADARAIQKNVEEAAVRKRCDLSERANPVADPSVLRRDRIENGGPK